MYVNLGTKSKFIGTFINGQMTDDFVMETKNIDHCHIFRFHLENGIAEAINDSDGGLINSSDSYLIGIIDCDMCVGGKARYGQSADSPFGILSFVK